LITDSIELKPLGQVAWDNGDARNERVRFTVRADQVERFHYGKLVRIVARSSPPREFVGKIVSGPFFPPPGQNAAGEATGELELQGEIENETLLGTTRRPRPGSPIFDLSFAEVGQLLRCTGDLLLGALTNAPNVFFSLRAKCKDVLPRNVGIFGTIGSGKTNTSQVLIEEAAEAGWAIVVIDVEGEYTHMDDPIDQPGAAQQLARYCRSPKGITNFKVFYPLTCSSDRGDAELFCLRLADFSVDVIAEILETSPGERSALRDCIEHLNMMNRASLKTTEKEELAGLINGGPAAKPPFTVFSLIQRAREKSPRSTEDMDYLGVLNKLTRLQNSGIMDHAQVQAIHPDQLIQPGKVSIFDVSVADDFVKSLVIADLLRKVFAYKIVKEESVPTLVVIEEAHTFINRQDRSTMQATLNMLRTVARRGRKRWLGMVFVSQQPGHLPPEIFELCNTRIVHNVRSLHNLEALVTTASDVGQETWTRCPLLRPGEAVISSPQLDRACEVTIRPAASFRKFTQ
jgi:DNA helicase HerA-like ATPase